jgi:hypothetical protein
MPSLSLQTWTAIRAAELDAVERAHRHISGTGPGRRVAMQQQNRAYVVLLAAQFQGFCRDLHTECVRKLVQATSPAGLHSILITEFSWNRKLDQGNPNPGNIGSDFRRLGVIFWTAVDAVDPSAPQCRMALEELNRWRNAIAHYDFDPAKLGGVTTLRLAQVRDWRKACDRLATTFDDAMYTHLLTRCGTAPW